MRTTMRAVTSTILLYIVTFHAPSCGVSAQFVNDGFCHVTAKFTFERGECDVTSREEEDTAEVYVDILEGQRDLFETLHEDTSHLQSLIDEWHRSGYPHISTGSDESDGSDETEPDCCGDSGEKLAVCDTKFCINRRQVFLAGVNLAYEAHGWDFGNGNYDNIAQQTYTSNVTKVREHGGNSIRFFLHAAGWETPHFDDNGYVIGPDRSGTLLDDLVTFLDHACSHNVLVFPTIWNAAANNRSKQFEDLWRDPVKLQSYIDHALIPIVERIRGHRGLGGFDIVNEPEAAMETTHHDNRCLDTSYVLDADKNIIHGGWKPPLVTPEEMLRFINWQADAIHRHSCELVTVGAWKVEVLTDAYPDAEKPSDIYEEPVRTRNYYSNKCLMAPRCAREYGYLDFYSSHTYAESHGGAPKQYIHLSPMRPGNNNDIYHMDKPHVIGEFSQTGGDSRTTSDLFEHAFTEGFDGAWSWQANEQGKDADKFQWQLDGLRHVSQLEDEEGRLTAVEDIEDCS